MAKSLIQVFILKNYENEAESTDTIYNKRKSIVGIISVWGRSFKKEIHSLGFTIMGFVKNSCHHIEGCYYIKRSLTSFGSWVSTQSNLKCPLNF